MNSWLFFQVSQRKDSMFKIVKWIWALYLRYVHIMYIYNYICEILMWNFNKGNSVNNPRVLYGLYACSYDKAKKNFFNLSLREKMIKVTNFNMMIRHINLKYFLNFHMRGRRCSLGMTPWALSYRHYIILVKTQHGVMGIW